VAEQWEKDVLATLRAPVTTGNLKLLRAWQRAEGGHTHNSATYNWLNTTRGKQFPAMNGVGVRQFPDYRTGVAYTADTIIGGYPGIMSALRAGKPYAPKYRPAIVSDFSKWVSGQRTGREDYATRSSACLLPLEPNFLLQETRVFHATTPPATATRSTCRTSCTSWTTGTTSGT
jgi:hypothetical protein